jgi:SOS-response transcriptional repressor LexA
MELKDRLKDSRKKTGKTQAEVAEAVGMSQPAYQGLESGKNQKSAFLPMIAKYLGVDGYWLTTGKNDDSHFEHNLLSPTVTTEGSDDGFIWIDVVQANFSCGPGEDIDFHFDRINGRFPFPPSFFKDKKVMPDTMRIIKAKGDSMADYIKDGDFVGIDISHTTIEDGDIYAVYFAGEGMLKQIFKEADGSLILHSHNEKYRDRTVSEENGQNFKVIGRQFWRAG